MTTESFADNAAKCFSNDFENSLEILAGELADNYENTIRPLNAEQKALMRESAALSKSLKESSETVESQLRVAQLQSDLLQIEGKKEEARAKFSEAEAALASAAAQRNRLAEIGARYRAIEIEKQAAARRVAIEWWGECAKVTRAAQHGFLVTLLNGLEQSLAEFRRDTNTEVYDWALSEGTTRAKLIDGDNEAWSIGTSLYEQSYAVPRRVTGVRR